MGPKDQKGVQTVPGHIILSKARCCFSKSSSAGSEYYMVMPARLFHNQLQLTNTLTRPQVQHKVTESMCIQAHGALLSLFWRPCMASNVSVQYNGGFLPGIILLTLCYYH